MRLGAAIIIVTVVSPLFASLPCESEYAALHEATASPDQWRLERAWASYATGRAESSDVLASAATRVRLEQPREREFAGVRSRLRLCLNNAAPVSVVPFSVKAFATLNGGESPINRAEIAIDGEIVGATDSIGFADLVATPRVHVIEVLEAWWAQPVVHIVDLSHPPADPIAFDLSLNHTGSDHGDYAIITALSRSACLDFRIAYQHSYKPARIAQIDRAIIMTPEAAISVGDLVTIAGARDAIQLRECGAFFSRLASFAPPYMLAVEATETSGARYEDVTEVYDGARRLAVNVLRADDNLPVPFASVSIRRWGSSRPFFRQTDDAGHVVFDSLAPGNYVIESVTTEAIARKGIELEADRSEDLRFAAPGAAVQEVESGDVHTILFGFDSNGRPVPSAYFRTSANHRELQRASSSLLHNLEARGMRSGFTGTIVADLFDAKQRLAFRTTEAVAIAVEAPGGPWFELPPERWWFILRLPAGFSKTLKLRGWLPQMETVFDLDQIARDYGQR